MAPTEKTIKRLFAMSGNRCAFPNCTSPIVEHDGTVTGEICHIRAQKAQGARHDQDQPERDRQSYKNLILLCRRHHRQVDSADKIYTVEVLAEMKSIHESRWQRPEEAFDGLYAKMLLNASQTIEINNNSGNVAIGSPGAMVGSVINIRAARQSVKVAPPPGTIGFDQRASRYVEHLISRYNELGSKDPFQKRAFNHGAVRKNIEHKFGAKWQLLPIAKLEMVVSYLQERINKTSLAKNNAARGAKSYSTFDVFDKKSGR